VYTVAYTFDAAGHVLSASESGKGAEKGTLLIILASLANISNVPFSVSFSVSFDFDPIWDWSEKSYRSAEGERRVRLAYIVNLGTDYDVTSVRAYARQLSDDLRLKITGLAPSP
jgi:hypothetical protein